ncbi:peptide deformylase [Beijerinckia indica]|uniref:Peptide deformylase n=1 Tax=Beijerinckia indica subsp. indica (strain ATCC 9039 / DSM 1715 / NCIMB 8712) TaxID=395963 RepID=B2IEV8_BEII9|nr:peptide deformylase [Beijerinckia indica]ACB94149.1 peptide deformylase [Beijerinckia indica subsp. indica ATCC 9039]
MALRSIITIPDPLLRRVCDPVADVDSEIRRLMDDMLETMYDAPGIGLAASQIAVMKRVIVMDVAKRRKGEDGAEADVAPQPLALANPEILWASEELSTYEEGCLSIPDYYEEVVRPARVRVGYLDRQGQRQELEADGILATCVQHEIDHLNGVLFIDHISRLKRERIVKKFSKAAKRDNHSAPKEKSKADSEA